MQLRGMVEQMLDVYMLLEQVLLIYMQIIKVHQINSYGAKMV